MIWYVAFVLIVAIYRIVTVYRHGRKKEMVLEKLEHSVETAETVAIFFQCFTGISSWTVRRWIKRWKKQRLVEVYDPFEENPWLQNNQYLRLTNRGKETLATGGYSFYNRIGGELFILVLLAGIFWVLMRPETWPQ